MRFKNDNIIIHKFIIERDLNNIFLCKCNNLHYNFKNKELLKSINYYNKIKLYYDKKYYLLKNDIYFFDLKYNKLMYNYNKFNDFNLDNYEKLINDRVIHHDIVINDYRKYFESHNIDNFLRVYFDVFLNIKNNYFGEKN